MKRVFWILITPLAILFLLGVALRYFILPKAETWALAELQSYSSQHLPVKIKASRLQIFLLKPSVGLEDIEITPQTEELKKAFDTITVRSVRAHLDLFQLLAGRPQLSAVVIDSPSVQLDIDPFLKSDSKPSALPIDQIFSITERIPLERVFIQNLYLDLKSPQNNLSVNVRQGGFLISNMGKNLTLKTEVPDLRVSLGKVGDFSGVFDAHLYLNRRSLKIIQLSLRLNDSELVTRGELTDIKNVTLHPEGILNVSAKITLSDIYREFKRMRPDLKIPFFEGSFNADSEIRFKGLDEITGKAQIQTHKLVIDKFQVGDASLQGSLLGNKVTLSEFKASHPAGEASLNNTVIEFDKNIHFESKIHVASMDMQKLFVSLDLKNIPVSAQMSGDVPCRGQFLDPLELECNGKIKGQKIWVRSKLNDEKSEVVAVDEVEAEGEMRLDADGIQYKTNITAGDSKGSSDGEILFKEGFHINYHTPSLDFKNVRNMANLKFSGHAAIDGSTEGNKETAIFDMKVNASDFIFEEYQLGNVGGDLKLRSGHLIFENIVGAQNKTQYLGAIDVDLEHKQINGQLKLPTFDIGDAAKIYERIYKFPIDVSGLGSGEIRFHGPLDFWKMSYQLDSRFKGIQFGPESFDNLYFNVEARDGDIRAKKVLVQKNASSLILSGGISSAKMMNLLAEAKNWRLEESDIMNKINPNTFGVMNATSEIKGLITTPNVLVRGSVTETVVEEQEIPKSEFVVRVDRNHLESNLNLFGDRIQGDILMPLGIAHSPLRIKVKTSDWQFSSLLGIFGGGSLMTEYDSSLTSEINLSSESGDLLKSTGDINIQDIFLKRANYSLKNSAPMSIHMNNGNISFKNFLLQGPHNQIKITGENFTSENLNMNISASLELRLIHMFLPFLEDIGGTVNTTASISGDIQSPKILGNLVLENGYFKIKNFPHPFEKMQSDMSFSHTRVLINSIKGQLGGGVLTGDGSILINGYHDLPTNIRAHLEGMTLNVPDRMRTTGDADLVLSGKWFPFVLSGTYKVSSAFVDKEFGDDGSAAGSTRQSVYLPKVLKQKTFEPMLMDLQILLEKNIIVKNSLADGSVTGNIQVKGAPQSPILAGRITFDKNSKLTFKDKVFEVQAGQIQFTNPNEIDPELYLSARSRVSDYDVSLLVQGTAKNMNIRLSSVPPLSDQDIISLLALGTVSPSSTNNQLTQTVQQRGDQQAQTSYELGAAIIGAPINKISEKTIGFNFQYSSSFDATRNINVPKVTLSRQLGERVNFSGSRVLGEESAYDVRLQYLINKNFSAIGSYEKRDSQDTSLGVTSQQDTQSFFGLDLEFKREFK